MKAPAAPYSPPLPVLAVAGVATLILLLLVAKTLTNFVVAIIQLGVILTALSIVLWAGSYLLRRVRP